MPVAILILLRTKNFNYKRKVKKIGLQYIVLQRIVTLVLLIKNL